MAPIYHGQFSFNVDTFYVTTSDGHIHPRATVSDLHAIFHTEIRDQGRSSNHLGHWYEAQLLHYGIAPTKKKTLAQSRLLEEIQTGGLKVPKHICKIEEDLKRDWMKQDLEVRSRAQEISLSLSGMLNATLTVPVSCPNTKRSFDDAQSTVLRTAKVDEPGMSATMVSQRSNASQHPIQNKKHKTNTEEPNGRSATTARCRRKADDTNPQAPNPADPSSETFARVPPAPMINGYNQSDSDRRSHQVECQTVRSSLQTISYPRDSQPYSIESGSSTNCRRYAYIPEVYPQQYNPFEPMRQSLGLINGEYNIISDDFEDWPEEIPLGGFNLALCLDGYKIWGEYDFGMFQGIFHMPERPMYASMKKHWFKWRGQDGDGVVKFTNANEGWMRFLGNGEVEGEINCSGWLQFGGQRRDGQGMGRPRDLFWLKQEWDRMCM